MISGESSTTVARPAQDVFDYMSDLRNDPEWHTDILEARLTSDGPVAKGSTYAITFKPFMGQSEGTVTVLEYDAPRRFAFRGQMGKMTPVITTTIEPEGGGSRVTRRVEMDPPGIMKLMQPLMKGMVRKQNAGHIANLKRVLESK
jgi:uncharacterized protein YndB with AHSA1/START domain